jgi:hypothetical protein
VKVCVDVSANVDSDPGIHQAGLIDLNNVQMPDLSGSFFANADNSVQTLNGDGNVFHLDQINNLVANNSLCDASVSYTAGNEAYSNGDPTNPWCCSDPTGNSHASASGGGFSMSASADGAYATANNSGAGADATVGGAVNGASISQAAFTQNIVLGANIQYNTMTLGVIGHDGGGAEIHHI